MFLPSSRHLATALTETKDCLRPISSKGQKEFAWHDRLIFEMRDRLEHVRHFIYKVFAISFQGFPLHMISIQELTPLVVIRCTEADLYEWPL